MTSINQRSTLLEKTLERVSGGGGGTDPEGLSGSMSHLINIKNRLQLQSDLASSLNSNIPYEEAPKGFLPGDGRTYSSILELERTRLENLSKSFDQLVIPEEKISELAVANKAENAWNSFISSTKELIQHNIDNAKKLLAA